MKILFTGGSSGGHFYPLIAVAEALHDYIKKEKILDPKLYYMGPDEYDPHALFVNEIMFKQIPAGKVRRYFSFLNFTDLFKTGWGILKAIISVYSTFPDVVFSKGSYSSFPVLFAARLFGIPIVIHESDTVPGKGNAWAAKFADRIAVSYPEAAEFFPKDKVAHTGHPIRKEILNPLKAGAHEFLHLNPNIPTILILGGSQGAQLINDTLLDTLSDLVKDYQIIHQTGKVNFEEVKGAAGVILKDNPNKDHYKPFEYLNDLAMRMAGGAADLVVSRAGSTIFEIAAWGIPSILIPITDSHGDHQRKNAFSYARTGACVVIEEANLSPHILAGEIVRLLNNQKERETMKDAAFKFSKPEAAATIAEEITRIALQHEN